MYTAEGYDALVKGSNIFLYVVFSLVVLAMLIIIVNTLMFERNLFKRKELSSTSHGKSSSDGPRTQISRSSNEKVSGRVEDGSRGNSEVGITASDLKFTRIVSFQATLYIVSFLISYSPTVASLAKDYPESGLVAYWRIFIANFQGVFVLIIFLYHKVHNVRRRQKDNTIMDALATVFLRKENVDDFFVENLTLVQESDDIRKRMAAAQQEELENAEVHMEKSESAKSSKIANSAELELYDGISFSSPSRPESGRYDNISFGTSNVHKDVKETSLNNNSSNAMSFGQVSSTGILSYRPEGTVDGRKSSPEIENGKRYYDIALELDDESSC
jgi:regulator of replication initiation timing